MKRPDPARISPCDAVEPVYYPLFVHLSGKRAVVVGGGKVAERKIRPLVKAGARVMVVSPVVTRGIERMVEKGLIEYRARSYRKGDLDGAFLVIAATDSSSVNEEVSRHAPCLVNVVDTPHLCNFIVPSTLRRGPLKIAISTSGVSPALSRTIRRELEALYGSEFSRYLHALKKIRHDAKQTISDTKRRADFLRCIASEEMIKQVRSKGARETKRTAKDLLKKAQAS